MRKKRTACPDADRRFFVKLFLIYLFLINVAAISLTVLDKTRARQSGRRISERTLLIVSALGGSPGMYLTMRKIHHKTRHAKFMIGIPCIFVTQLLVVFFYFFFIQ